MHKKPDFESSYKLYGTTGSGNPLNLDGPINTRLETGWFIGWVEKEDTKIICAYYHEVGPHKDMCAGLRAKNIVKNKILKIM